MCLKNTLQLFHLVCPKLYVANIKYILCTEIYLALTREISVSMTKKGSFILSIKTKLATIYYDIPKTGSEQLQIYNLK